jgi:hypothetical protein
LTPALVRIFPCWNTKSESLSVGVEKPLFGTSASV